MSLSESLLLEWGIANRVVAWKLEFDNFQDPLLST